MKLPQMKLSKPSISIVLWLIFLLVVAIEVTVLYRVLYVQPNRLATEQSQERADSGSEIKFEVYQEVDQWFQGREDAPAPDYQLQQGDLGRENPFAEY